MNSKKYYIIILLLCNNELVLGLFNVIFNEDVVDIFGQITLVIALIWSTLQYNIFKNHLKLFYILIWLLLLSLIIQSLFVYGQFFVYPHVFSKIFLLFIPLMIYYFDKKYNSFSLGVIANIILFFYFFDLFGLGWIRFFSPFDLQNIHELYGGAGDSRVFHASAVYLLIVPLLYYLNKYTSEKKVNYFLLFLIILFIILIQNHRTVWVSTIFALLVNFYLFNKRDRIQKSFSSIKIGVIFVALINISFVILIFYFPNLSSELFSRYQDIVNFEHQGTGQWRYEQVLSYVPFILDNLLFGMRLKGFEIDSIIGFGVASGQHFHNGYLEFLFYFGITGLILSYGIIIYVYRTFIKSRNFDIDNIVLAAFVLSGFIFSFGYRLPIFYWGFLGLLLSRVVNVRK